MWREMIEVDGSGLKRCGKDGCNIIISDTRLFCGTHGHYKKQQQKLEDFMNE